MEASCFCLSNHGVLSRYLLMYPIRKQLFSLHPVFVCHLRIPQTAHPTPPRNWRPLCSRLSPRPSRRDTSAHWDFATIPIGSQTTTTWTRWDNMVKLYPYIFLRVNYCRHSFKYHTVFLFSRCLGFPAMSPSRTKKSSVSTLGSAAGSDPLSVIMDASQSVPGSLATRTTVTQLCVTNSSTWTTPSPTSTSTKQRHRSTTTPTHWPRRSHPQTLIQHLDP